MQKRYLCIYSLIFMIYGLTIAVNFSSSDAQVMYETSRELVFHSTIALSDNYNLPQIYEGGDDRWYSQYDPGLPLLAAPLIWLSDQLAQSQQWHRYNFSAYVVHWLSAGFAALAVYTLFTWARELYQDQRTALLIAIAAGFCTPLLVYARMFFAEATLAGLLTFSFYGAYRKWGLWAGLALGLAILTRAAMVIYLLPVLWLLVRLSVAQGRDKEDRSDSLRSLRPVPTIKRSLDNVALAHCLKFMIFPVLAILGLLYHNQIRNDDPFVFGYGDQRFDTPIYEGIIGLLFSPGKSVFLYAPPLILSILGARGFYRRQRVLAEALLMACVIALLFYSHWWAWHGGWCWGPRLLVPIIPALVLPAGEIFNKITETDNPVWLSLQQFAIYIVLLLGFVISLAGLVTDINKYYALHEGHDDMVNYNLDASPITGAIRDGLTGENLIKLAAFNLQEYGWAQSGAIAFPIILMFVLISSLLMLKKEFTREQ